MEVLFRDKNVVFSQVRQILVEYHPPQSKARILQAPRLQADQATHV